MREKKKRNIIIGALCTVLLLMVVGYAAFNSVLKIKGTSTISSNWDIKITSITSETLSGSATNAKDPEGVGTLTASFETNLVSPGDSMEYDITIENQGNMDAKLDKITLSDPNHEYITFTAEIDGDSLNVGENTTFTEKAQTLNVGESKILTVKVSFKDVEINKMDPTNAELTVTLDYSQADGDTITPTNQHLLTYDCTTNGGNDCTENNEYLEEGANVNLSYTASKNGYKFIGWNTDKDATEGLTDLTMPSQDTTLFAIFQQILLKEPTIEIKGDGVTTSTTTYPWTQTDGVWKSGNQGIKSSTSSLTFNFNLSETTDISFDWTVSSQKTYDYLYYTIYKDGTTMSGTGTSTKISGTDYGETEESLTYNTVSKSLEPGNYKITFSYYKNASTDTGLDTAYVKNFSLTNTSATIKYPSGCENGISCTYSLNGVETETTLDSVELDIMEDTTLIAKTTYEGQEKNTEKIFDFTAPVVTLNTSTTTNSITAVISATDTLSEITKYEFSIDGNEWIDNGTNNVYTFYNLSNKKSHTIKTRTTNSVNLKTISSKSVSLQKIETPTYSQSKIDDGLRITVTYPQGCGSEYTCSYIKDNVSEVAVTTEEVNVDFTKDGTLVAKVSDGINTTSSSYTVMVPITLGGLKIDIVSSGDGLYTDEYEAGRYVYKGANPDNYITFNNETWRILSVESDGTLKIMKKDIIGKMAFDSNGYRDNTSDGAGGTYCYSSHNYGCNAWAVSDNFVNGMMGTVLKDAEINTYLNNDYYNTLSSKAKSLIQTHTWGIGPVLSNQNLATQIQSENETTWNGNIGLMSGSDYLRVNTNTTQCGSFGLNNNNLDTCKTTNYIISSVPTSGYLLTISPTVGSPDLVWTVRSIGSVYGLPANYSYSGVLPTLYLKSDITLSGSGTSSDPYTIN